MYLLQMAGFPGSGKSTIANQISKRMNAIVLDRDIVKTSMLNSGIKDQVLADASYLVVFDLADFYLSKGISVIIDTPCFYQETVDKGVELCNKNGSSYKYLECIVDEYEEIERRLGSRKRLATQIESTTEERYYSVYNKSVKPQEHEILTINTTSAKYYDMDFVVDYLNK